MIVLTYQRAITIGPVSQHATVIVLIAHPVPIAANAPIARIVLIARNVLIAQNALPAQSALSAHPARSARPALISPLARQDAIAIVLSLVAISTMARNTIPIVATK